MAALCNGIDLVDIEKLKRVFRGRPDLLEAVFTESERMNCLRARDPWKHAAGHFAAKEAFLKALGLGFQSAGIAEVLLQVEVSCRGEKVQIIVHGWLHGVGRRRRIAHCSVSLGQSSRYAVAAVSVVSNGAGLK